MSLAVGSRLGPYEVIGPLGAGGMGQVYRARDTRLGRLVAVKIVTDSLAESPAARQRFEQEARAVAALSHPNILALHDVGHEGPIVFAVTELLEGETLQDRLQRGPLPLRKLIEAGTAIADGLAAAHAKGIVHRDLKPSNVFLTTDGRVKVLDFGLAKQRAPVAREGLEASPTVSQTEPGTVLGTVGYMSPEQIRGDPADTRSDIFSLGCVLYEMASGERAFARDTAAETLAAIMRDEPRGLVESGRVPAELQRIIAHCLEKNRDERFQSASDLAFALRTAGGSSAASVGAPAPSRWRVPALVGVAALGAAAAFVLIKLVPARTAPPPVSDASLGPRFTRLTFDAGLSTEPALSADGTLVAYASNRDGETNLDLWVQRVAGGEPIRLTRDPADDREPDFSPDGSLIAFRSDRDSGGVFVLPALGGDVRLVAERGRRPRFSPDGSRIAYWTGGWLSGPREPGTAVFVVPATGGRSTRVASGFVIARSPIWSPDGRSLMFFGRKQRPDQREAADPPGPYPGGFDWWWISLDGGEPVQTGAYALFSQKGLAGDLGNAAVFGAEDMLPAVWTDSGMLFSARLAQSVNLWRVSVSERNGKIEGVPIRLTYGVGGDFAPSADKTGRVAFQVSTTRNSSFTLPLDPDAGKVLGPLERRSSHVGLQGGRSSVSEDGRLLAYAKRRATFTEVWVKDLTTSQERHLVTTPPAQLSLVTLRDGSHVAYTVVEAGRSSGYVVRVAGGTTRKVCDDCYLQAWLADGRRMLIVRGRPARVQVLDVTDGTASDALMASQAVFRPHASWDNRWLAVINRGQVWIAPLRPGSPPPESDWAAVLTISAGSAERACGWSPNGRLLYLLLELDGFRCLYAQRVDPARGVPIGQPFLVHHFHDPERRWGSTPLGSAIVRRAFVLDQVETTGSIWLLDPSGREPSR